MKIINKNNGEIFDYKKYDNKVLFGPIFWFHIVIELVSWSSPFFVSWWIILIGALLLQLQFLTLGGCIINKIHFKESKNSVFVYPYLKMMGSSISFGTTKLIMWYILPVILILTAVIWQLVLGHNTII